jgi:hypothetical protein
LNIRQRPSAFRDFIHAEVLSPQMRLLEKPSASPNPLPFAVVVVKFSFYQAIKKAK